MDVQDIPLKRIDGGEDRLANHRGRVLLVVNVASKCGLTPQYEGLQALFERYRDQGFEVLGFPANNFMGQEPGSDEEIAAFCTTQFDVDFLLFSKISVAGADKHPLYDALTKAQPRAIGGEMHQRLEGHGIVPNPEPEILWNFEKFLIGRDGSVVSRFGPDVPPDDATVTQAIEQELAKPQ